ncbi:pyridoxal phosphate-dependent transferase [Schizophyllum amplum]|uniref:Kynureninase n=1 Tax=Schizophyllum amplum TaxID=97359 RepID=A0A550CAT1_9AGAR|nr:pyridoxal phosphate-dependent transferase [Auriculariopsis ampla]
MATTSLVPYVSEDNNQRLAPLADGAFFLPTNRDIDAYRNPDQDATATYVCGASLGPFPKRSKVRLDEELDIWQKQVVIGHFNHPLKRPWKRYTENVVPLMAEAVGAKEGEVALMGALTQNLHTMLDLFYRPTEGRYKILCEANAFPSDQYAMASKVRAAGLDPKTAIHQVYPRKGEYAVTEADIYEAIEQEGDKIAVVLFAGIHYWTGQLFSIKEITAAAHKKGCIVGWDLAHAAGNVTLSLHDWGVDFAVWCNYKFLNAGPGSIGALFMHEKWNEEKTPRAAGWWGHKLETRFQFLPEHDPIPGAQGLQVSNTDILSSAAVLGALETLKEAGMMEPVRQRSIQLTGLLQTLVMKSKHYVPLAQASERKTPGFTIVTPLEADRRGAQLSLLFLPTGQGIMQKIYYAMKSFGVIADERPPDLYRIVPNPLYNSSDDIVRVAECLNASFKFVETQAKL